MIPATVASNSDIKVLMFTLFRVGIQHLLQVL